jgi:hypothetical protein
MWLPVRGNLQPITIKVISLFTWGYTWLFTSEKTVHYFQNLRFTRGHMWLSKSELDSVVSKSTYHGIISREHFWQPFKDKRHLERA